MRISALRLGGEGLSASDPAGKGPDIVYEADDRSSYSDGVIVIVKLEWKWS